MWILHKEIGISHTIFLLSLFSCSKHCQLQTNTTDLKFCKVTHLGLSFAGFISKTRDGHKCRWWLTEKRNGLDVDNRSLTFNDEDFPEKSINKAKNYCRNPIKSDEGPWCYTTGANERESCDIPLCRYKHCRITGPGMEYAGKRADVGSLNCEKWSQIQHKLLRYSNGPEKYNLPLFTSNFPERNVDSNFCRNPDGDLGGKLVTTQIKDFSVLVCL